MVLSLVLSLVVLGTEMGSLVLLGVAAISTVLLSPSRLSGRVATGDLMAVICGVLLFDKPKEEEHTDEEEEGPPPAPAQGNDTIATT